MQTHTKKTHPLRHHAFVIPFASLSITCLCFAMFMHSEHLGGIIIRNTELQTSNQVNPPKQTIVTQKSNRASARLRTMALISKNNTQSAQNRILPQRVTSSVKGLTNNSIVPISPKLKGSAPNEEFPAPGNVIHPVVRVPNWGDMYSPSEWNRTYAQMPNSVFIAVPEYNLEVLTTPMETLLQNRSNNIDKITAKLYYSTRHFGHYHLDAGEYTGKHAGIDLKLPKGTPFGSIAGGRVYKTATEDVLGNYVIIEHRIDGEVYFSIYGHMDRIDVQEGQDVRSGETIGTVGSTGRSTGYHIHLQVNKGTQNANWRSKEVLSRSESSKYTVHPIDFIDKY